MIFATKGEGQVRSRARTISGIKIHHNTSVYINRNEVELRLGMNMEVHEAVILLTISQTTLENITRHPHPRPSNEL
jgi:hypothetical protein